METGRKIKLQKHHGTWPFGRGTTLLGGLTMVMNHFFNWDGPPSSRYFYSKHSMPGKSLQTVRSTQYDWIWDVLIFHGSLSNGLFVTRSCLMFFWISIHGIVVYRPPYCPSYLYPSARWNWMATSPICGSPVPTYIDLFDLPVNSSWIFQKPDRKSVV